MKKIFFLACLLLSATMTFAASEVKKVAILEVVDKDSKLDYSQKLVLRSCLAKAITKTPGYEAYDRTDIDAIMSEHQFQNTGLVSKDQIQKLGEMAGVSLILVAEGALTGDKKMFVAVKVLDVQTAKVVMTDNTMMGLSSEEMQYGCELVANNLFSKKSKFGKKQATPAPAYAAPVVAAQPAAQQQPVAQTAAQPKTAPATQPASKSNNMVTRISRKEYIYQGISMDAKGYEKFLLGNCAPAYKQFNTGKKLVTGGWVCASVGLAMIIIGIPMMAAGDGSSSSTTYYYDDGYSYSTSSNNSSDGLTGVGAAFISIGAISAATSIPLFVVGSIKKKKSVNIYNTQCVAQSDKIRFNMLAGKNSIGLAMQF